MTAHPDATTHARALAALDGARAAHLWGDALVVLGVAG